jgi:hypothetical protein
MSSAESPAHHFVSLQAIRSKRNELLASAAKYDALADKARKEAADYEAAERVWHKLAPADLLLDQMEIDIKGMATGDRAVPVRTAARKPAGVPPVPSMIIQMLADAAEAGKPGLTPAEILDGIQLMYWKDAKSTDVGSTAWRMWRDGRLAKPDEHSPLYTLPQVKEDAA